MLLAIDCGNTQTVIGLFSDRELVDHWRIATVAERTSDELALMFQQFLGFHGFSFDAHVSGVVIASGVPRVTAALREMTERYFGLRGAGARARRAHRDADPLRRAQERRRRPHRQRGRRVRPLRRPDDRRRLRHRQHRRRGEREGRVPRWRDLSRHRDLARRAVRTRGRAAPGGARRAEERDRQVDDRSDPVRRGVRLQRSGRRHRRPLRSGARAVDGRLDRGPGGADHAALPRPSSTSSPGSPSRACASSTSEIGRRYPPRPRTRQCREAGVSSRG